MLNHDWLKDKSISKYVNLIGYEKKREQKDCKNSASDWPIKQFNEAKILKSDWMKHNGCPPAARGH